VYVSSGAACSAGSKETSHVIRALGLDPGIGIIRFSLGLNSSVDDIEYLFTYLPEILAELRQNQRET
jgi:cysteine desulfurase